MAQIDSMAKRRALVGESESVRTRIELVQVKKKMDMLGVSPRPKKVMAARASKARPRWPQPAPRMELLMIEAMCDAAETVLEAMVEKMPSPPTKERLPAVSSPRTRRTKQVSKMRQSTDESTGPPVVILPAMPVPTPHRPPRHLRHVRARIDIGADGPNRTKTPKTPKTPMTPEWSSEVEIRTAPRRRARRRKRKPSSGAPAPAAPLAVEAELSNAQEALVQQAERFDAVHGQLKETARAHLAEAGKHPGASKAESSYVAALQNMFSQRFIDPSALKADFGNGPQPKQVRKKRGPRWKLSTSFWKGRSPLYESPSEVRATFDADWVVARSTHDLDWFIVRMTRGKSLRPRDSVHGFRADVALFPELEAVREELVKHNHLLDGAFDYYAAFASETESSDGEPDVYHISFNSFMSFVSAMRMVSPSMSHGEFQQLYAIVNETDEVTSGADRINSPTGLNRSEFIHCLVRSAAAMATKKQRGSDGTGLDVAAAIRQMMEMHMCHLPPAAVQQSDLFRKRICYIEQVSVVIEAHLPSLKAIFDRYAYVHQTVGDTMRDDAALSIGEWLTLVRHLGFISSGQLTLHDATMIFTWTRTSSCTLEHCQLVQDLVAEWSATAANADPNSPHAVVAHRSKQKAPDMRPMDVSERRRRNLTRLEFIEALLRMSTMLALPTDLEIEEAGAADAGEFLIALQSSSPQLYADFLHERRPRHSMPDCTDFHQHSAQPVWRCVEHLIKIIVRTIEGSTVREPAGADGVVQEDEIARFLKQRSKGLELKLVDSLASNEKGIDFTEVMQGAKARRLLQSSVLTIQGAFRFKIMRNKVKARVMLKNNFLAASALKIQQMVRKHNARERFRAVIEARGKQQDAVLYRIAKQRNRLSQS